VSLFLAECCFLAAVGISVYAALRLIKRGGIPFFVAMALVMLCFYGFLRFGHII
jgi:hypothetical protein